MLLVFFEVGGSKFGLILGASLIGFNFGGNFALFPSGCADSFGAENLGLNYGFLFTAYGIGGIVGPILAGLVQDAGLSFLYAFIPAAAMCAIAVGLAFAYQFRSKKIV